MSRLERLFGKPKEYDIGGEKFLLKPMRVKNLDLIVKISDKDQQTEAMKQLISIALKDSVHDATDEEINNVSFEYIKPLMDAIINVNGLEDLIDKKKVMGNLSSDSETQEK